MAAAGNAALQHDVSALQAETEQMQSRLASTLASFDRVQQDAQAVEGEVVDEVQVHSAIIQQHVKRCNAHSCS